MGANNGWDDIWVLKTNAAGTIQWKKIYGSSSLEFIASPGCIINTSDGGYIFIASTTSNDGDVSGFHPGAVVGIPDVWVVKIDNSGNIQWQKCYGGSGRESGYTIQQTTDGGYIIGAQSETDG